MNRNRLVLIATACLCAGAFQPPSSIHLASSTDIPGLLVSSLVFTAADTNKDGVVTRDELKAALDGWFSKADGTHSGSVSADQLVPVLNAAMPVAGLAGMLGPGRGGQPQTPDAVTVQAMMAALPSSAPARPAAPRKVLVLARAA